MAGVFRFFRITYLAIRPVNLLIILATQLLTFYWLGIPLTCDALLFILASITAAAGGNVINDIKDLDGDLVNKPSQVWVKNMVSIRNALHIYWILFFLAMGIALSVSLLAYFSILMVQLLLFAYSQWLSRVALVGNALIAFLTAAVILVIPRIFYVPYNESILTIALIAFFLNLLREIVKDIQDVEGDKLLKRKTLPVIIGAKKAKRFLTLVVIAAVIYLDYRSFCFLDSPEGECAHPFFSGFGLYVFYLVLFLLPAHILLVETFRVNFEKISVRRVSAWLKIMMLCGLSLWLIYSL